jgi:hypothetical protein
MPKGKDKAKSSCDRTNNNTKGTQERVERVSHPRKAALDFVTSGGKHTLKVDQWLDAGPPNGGKPEASHATGVSCPPQTTSSNFPFSHISNLAPPSQYATQQSVHYAHAKTGIQGRVVESGESFTVRDDYDFANPGSDGKGYHANAQLGKEKVAFCQTGLSSQGMYYDRTNMTGERHYFDGPEAAAKWYTNANSK